MSKFVPFNGYVKNKKRRGICLYISQEFHDEIRVVAEKHKLTTTALIRQMVEHCMRELTERP